MARIPPAKIDEILGAADILSYATRYISLKKTGKNLRGLCPFHKEKTPSFTISPEKQIFHCFGCGKGGNLFSFLMEIEHISYLEAVKKVAFDVGIALPKTEKTISSAYDRYYEINRSVKDFFATSLKNKEGTQGRNYLHERKLKPETLSKFEIGFAQNKWDSLLKVAKQKQFKLDTMCELGLIQKKEQGDGHFDKFRARIMFPFFNAFGRIVGFGGRSLSEKDQPKYLNSPESPIYKKGELLYGLFQAISIIREKKCAILVEGYFDLLRLVDIGIENVIASSGTALTEGQGRIIKRYTDTIIICYDSDKAGINAALRNGEILENLDLNVFIVNIPKPHDPDSFVLQEGKMAFFELLKKRVTPIEFRLQSFLNQKENDSIEIRNKFIDDLLNLLVNLPNQVKIGLYIHQIAEKFNLAESLILDRFNKLKKDKRKINRSLEEDKEQNLTEMKFRKGLWRAEEGIITLLLQNKEELSRHVFQSISSSDFENDDLKALFEQIAHDWEELGGIDLNKIRNNLITQEDISTFSRLSLIEIQNPPKFATDCIYQLKKRSLNLRFNEIKRLLQEESTSQKSILHYMKELNEIRHKLSQIENDHAKLSKI